MMIRIKRLAQRRALLATECALQRITLTGQTQALGEITNWFNAGNRLVSHFKNLPGWMGALLAVVVILAPGRALSLAKNGLLLLQLWRSFSAKSDTP